MNLDLTITFVFQTDAAKPPLDAVLAKDGVIGIKRNWLFDDMPQEYEITYHITTPDEMAQLAAKLRAEPAALAVVTVSGEVETLLQESREIAALRDPQIAMLNPAIKTVTRKVWCPIGMRISAKQRFLDWAEGFGNGA